jgi:threonine/homoserine/homoserine lactone efflux protein
MPRDGQNRTRSNLGWSWTIVSRHWLGQSPLFLDQRRQADVTLELALAAAAFCFAGALTPGPNNVMLLASGVNFGFARTVPHMVGVVAGYAFLILVVGMGLGQTVVEHPVAFQALRIGGALYMVWLAWKVATASGGPKDEGRGSPLTFFEAAAFQWVNLKGVLVAISGVAAFTRPSAFGVTLATLIAIATAATMTSVVVWSAFGTGLRQFLTDPRKARVFNVVMAVLLLASLYPMLVEV